MLRVLRVLLVRPWTSATATNRPMQYDLCQRWNRRVDTYRPPDEPIEPASYYVDRIDKDTPAKAYVISHHYSASYPAARRRFGLFRGSDLVGVAVFSMPATAAVLTNHFDGEATDHLELGRFVYLLRIVGGGL